MMRWLLLASLLGSALAGDFTVRIQAKQAMSYPPALAVPTAAETPKAWLDALDAAVAAGKIPNIAPATMQGGNPVYANSVGLDPKTCSWTVTKCVKPTDIVNIPDNHIAVSFDDGPTGVSGDLYTFLSQNNQTATHFMIGSNVLSYPKQFAQALKQGNQHFAVHTWSHKYCTTLTNQQLVAELGWTMQIIADSSGGYMPKFWRPPYGDVDNRVRAIAEEIFGLTNVLWNHDTNDWCLQDNGPSECPGQVPGKDYASVAAAANAGVNGPKTPGLMMLEHELSHESIKVFKTYYPTLKGLGWIPDNVPNMFSSPWYKNAFNDKAAPQNSSILLTAAFGASPSNVTLSATPSNATTGQLFNSTSGAAGTQSTGALTSHSASAAAEHSTSGALAFASASVGFAGLSTLVIIAVTLL